MPRLGWDMQVGNVAEWLKQDGERVEVGEPICMITGDKATTELEAPESGILRISSRAPLPGVEVPVGTLLAYLVAPGEDIPAEEDIAAEADADPAPHAEEAAPRSSADAAKPEMRPASRSDPSAAPAADASRHGRPASDVDASRHGRPAEADPSRHGKPATEVDAGRRERHGTGARTVATPRARRAAAGLGVDWRTLTGSGRGGRILERDVLGQADTQAAALSASEAAPAALWGRSLTGIRRLTAERMALSARTAAPVTLTTEADATTLVRLREQALAERGSSVEGVPGYTDLLVKLVGLALVEHPALNAELTDTGIVEHAHVNVALAVDTPAGLIAPVVRDAPWLPLDTIARQSRRLIEAARSGSIRPEELSGATFTLTNLGMYDVDAFTPIVNLPQCAILGVGRIVARPVVIDQATEQIGVRRMLTLSLTFDHRLVDGAPAARFLQHIKHLVERPTLWLFR